MDLNKYVPRARAEALIAAAEDRAELAEEGLRITQGEIIDCEARALEAESKVAAADERAKAAEAKAANEEKDCEKAEALAAKERDLRGKADSAEANVRADLKIAQAAVASERAKHADCERELRTAQATIETQRKSLQEAIVKASTEERLRLAAEKKPGKSVAVAAPAMSPVGYEIAIQRTSDGTMNKLVLTPRKPH